MGQTMNFKDIGPGDTVFTEEGSGIAFLFNPVNQCWILKEGKYAMPIVATIYNTVKIKRVAGRRRYRCGRRV
jgi:hypothetical protein